MNRLGGLLVLASALIPAAASAIVLDDPVNFRLVQVWSAASFGVPGRPAGMLFSDDGQTLLIVGNSETAQSALYALPLMRDPATKRVLGFGAATLVFAGDPSHPGLDAGLERGPEGTLFYTYWSAHRLGERPVATSTVETAFDMTPTGVPSSVAGLAFSPHRLDVGSGFAQLQVSSWLGNGIYNIPLIPRGGAIYEPGVAELFVQLPQEGTGAIQYVPEGRFKGNLMYVNWNFGEVRMLEIDRDTGLPIDDTTGLPTLGTSTPRDRRFASDLGEGPWGLEFDPLTLDFFVTTWDGAPANSIIQFSGPGFANQPPVAQSSTVSVVRSSAVSITLVASDPDLDPLTFRVVSGPTSGTITGTTGSVVYRPNAGFLGVDRFTFDAFDGQLRSNTATVTVNVLAEAPDAGTSDTGAAGSDAAAASDSGAARDAADAPPPDAGSGALDGGESRDAASTAADTGGTDDGDSGCGCAAAGAASGGPHTSALLSLLAVLALRRRRRR